MQAHELEHGRHYFFTHSGKEYQGAYRQNALGQDIFDTGTLTFAVENSRDIEPVPSREAIRSLANALEGIGI